MVEEQYYLSKLAHISILESNRLPDFEREIYSNLLSRDLQAEAESMKKQAKY